MAVDATISLLATTDVWAYIEGSTTGSSSGVPGYEALVDSVSAQFNMWTERILKFNYYPSTDVTKTFYDVDDYDGNGTAYLYLRQFPISSTGITVYIDDTYQFTTDTIVPTSDVRIEYMTGRLFLINEIFKQGYCDIRVLYSAGYSSSAIPQDLKRAALEMCQWWWNRMSKKDRIGVRSESFEGGSRTFETDMPWSVKKVLEHYRSPHYG